MVRTLDRNHEVYCSIISWFVNWNQVFFFFFLNHGGGTISFVWQTDNRKAMANHSYSQDNS